MRGPLACFLVERAGNPIFLAQVLQRSRTQAVLMQMPGNLVKIPCLWLRKRRLWPKHAPVEDQGKKPEIIMLTIRGISVGPEPFFS
jgi:hypothetical protein